MGRRCKHGLVHYHHNPGMLLRVTAALLVLLLTPTACTGPTIQMDVYTWGYEDGVANYLGWHQCDFKSCKDVLSCFSSHYDAMSIDYEIFEYDSLVIQGDNWTNECIDTVATYIY